MLLATAFDILAQAGTPVHEPPPGSDKVLQLTRYLTWLLVIAGVAAVVIGIPVLVFVVLRFGRRGPGGRNGPGGPQEYGGPPPGPRGPGG
ncbi:hypothetical protein [Nocardia carnea]|uniref:hypothetical protein n=1 Tax=Nocardia carnea TaxID=37328 RepID=UPI002457FA3A|nr:hypothetical protein [Nocardia carnea]